MSGLISILLFEEALLKHLPYLILQPADHPAIVVEEDPIVMWEVFFFDFI